METALQQIATNVIPFPEGEYEDLFPEERGEIINTLDVTQKIYAIRQVEKLRDQYDQQDQESREFYALKKQHCEQRMDYLKRNIFTFLQQLGLSRLSTPAGTAYTRTQTTRHWPEDAILIAWAKEHAPDAILHKEQPDKRAIAEAIASSDNRPPGYFETTDSRLHIK